VGKRRGDRGGFVGAGGGRIWQGFYRIEEENQRGGSVTGVISGWRRKMMTCPDRWGPGVSEGRNKCVPVRGGKEDGP
jgi:hypothetical protein